MFICNTCGAKFEEMAIYYQRHPYGESTAAEPIGICPYCSDTDIEECEEI